MILLGLLINIIINPEYHYDVGKLKLYFQFNNIAFMFLIVILIFCFLAYYLRKLEFDLSKNKKVIYSIYITMAMMVIFAVIIVYAIDFKTGILYEVHELLHGNFDDNFGTYRVFLWKRTISIIGDNFLIGTGPDTFAIRFMDKYTNDIILLGEELSINDTAANVYLTMLVNIGFLGLISYLLVIIFQIITGFKNKNKYSFVLLIAIFSYLIQDVFNLWVVIVTPIFWVLMAIHFLSIKFKEAIDVDK